MYKLFAAAQAIEFSDGCHAKCNNFVVKSNEFPFASTPGFSAPVYEICDILYSKKQKYDEILLKSDKGK